LEELERRLAHPRVLALGEIGLDYHWDYAPRDIQHRALRDQLDLAVRLDVPVVFHAREAYSDLLDVLEEYASHSFLLHCFAGTPEDALRAVELGCYFGFDGPLTYKKADALRDLVASLPHDQVVVETDSPYMTPVPHRGKPNRPAYVAYVADTLATVWGVSPEEARRITTQNAGRFFGSRLVRC
jgi:TatD DNase family protein